MAPQKLLAVGRQGGRRTTGSPCRAPAEFCCTWWLVGVPTATQALAHGLCRRHEGCWLRVVLVWARTCGTRRLVGHGATAPHPLDTRALVGPLSLKG
jgi:hypothetical protein